MVPATVAPVLQSKNALLLILVMRSGEPEQSGALDLPLYLKTPGSVTFNVQQECEISMFNLSVFRSLQCETFDLTAT